MCPFFSLKRRLPLSNLASKQKTKRSGLFRLRGFRLVSVDKVDFVVQVIPRIAELLLSLATKT